MLKTLKNKRIIIKFKIQKTLCKTPPLTVHSEYEHMRTNIEMWVIQHTWHTPAEQFGDTEELQRQHYEQSIKERDVAAQRGIIQPQPAVQADGMASSHSIRRISPGLHNNKFDRKVKQNMSVCMSPNDRQYPRSLNSVARAR